MSTNKYTSSDNQSRKWHLSNRKHGPSSSEHGYFTVTELGLKCALRPDQVNDFVDQGVIVNDGPKSGLYSIEQLERLHSACRMKQHYGIEASSANRALMILDRVERLVECENWLRLACLDSHNTTMQ